MLDPHIILRILQTLSVALSLSLSLFLILATVSNLICTFFFYLHLVPSLTERGWPPFSCFNWIGIPDFAFLSSTIPFMTTAATCSAPFPSFRVRRAKLCFLAAGPQGCLMPGPVFSCKQIPHGPFSFLSVFHSLYFLSLLCLVQYGHFCPLSFWLCKYHSNRFSHPGPPEFEYFGA